MKRTLGLTSAVVLWGILHCNGATNSTSATLPFFHPPIELRPYDGWVSIKPMPAEPTPSHQEEKPVRKSFLDGGDLDATLVERAQLYLYRVRARDDSPLDRIFTPEVVHLGKSSLSCPFLTVIKRRNPLCVLSGFSLSQTLTGDGQIVFSILNISW